MKKLISIVMVMTAIATLVGCGAQNTVSKENASIVSETQLQSEQEASDKLTATVDYKATIPNVGASFTGGSMKLVEMTDSKYHVRITGCDLEAYNAFVEKCKTTYPNVKTNMDYARGQHSFEAYTADGSYKMGVYFYTDENSNPTYIDIICEYKLD